MVHFNNVNDNGLPNEIDHKKVENFEDLIDRFLNEDKKKPNGLFLGRITWNKTAELIWRIHDADIANEVIRMIIKKKKFPFYFDYRIDPDMEWKLTEWHLKEREYDANKDD